MTSASLGFALGVPLAGLGGVLAVDGCDVAGAVATALLPLVFGFVDCVPLAGAVLDFRGVDFMRRRRAWRASFRE